MTTKKQSNCFCYMSDAMTRKNRNTAERKFQTINVKSEIEITPEMIDAGVKTFLSNETAYPSQQKVAEAVREIFTAMSRAAST